MLTRYCAAGVLLAVGLGLSGCDRIQRAFLAASQPKVVKSKDGAFQITVPGGWSENRNLNAEADIGAANPRQELYVIVLSENTSDFEYTMEDYAVFTRDKFVSSLKTPTVSEVRPVSVAGASGVQYEIRGASDQVRIVALHTTVNLGGHYHQILAWTLNSKWDKNQPILHQVVNSFGPSSGAAASR